MSVINNSLRMNFLYSFIFLSLLPTSIAKRDTVPVLLLDFESVMTHIYIDSNPFNKFSSANFAELMHDAIKKSEIVILFVEENLSMEDLSIKDKLGTPYFHLHQGLLKKKVKYLPSVISPYRIMNQIFQPQHFNVFHLSGSTIELQLFDIKYKYFYIYFKDNEEQPRTDVLRRHDLIMRQVYFVIRHLANGAVTAFYTGKTNPVVVEKLNFVHFKPNKLPRNPGVMLVTNGGLFKFNGVFSSTPIRRSMFSQIPIVAEQTWSNHKLITRMAYTDFELQFNFNFLREGWILDNVMLLEAGEEVGRTKMGVGAPWDWSYVCGEPLILVNNRDGSTVTISQYQIEPFPYVDFNFWSYGLRSKNDTGGGGNGTSGGGNTTTSKSDTTKNFDFLTHNTKTCFSKTVNCGPYFNANILAGLMVTFMFLGILSVGINMLFNCCSNNRYDDPQSKALVLSR